MTKSELINAIVHRVAQQEGRGLTRTDIDRILTAQAEVITEHFARDAVHPHVGTEVTIPGLGKLKTAPRASRTGRNPRTGEAMEIAARTAVKFAPSKALSDALNP